MLKKIILLFKLILRSKFILKTPATYDLVVFDKESVRDLNICLKKYNFFVLQTRFEFTDKIYFSLWILKKIIKNYSKGNLYTVYLISLIELINPKVVITTIDNSLKFSEISKILEKKINFIAIQNANRIDFIEMNYLYNTKKFNNNFLEKYYIPNFFCFGDYERELYKQFNIKVKNFLPVGSLRLANYFYHTQKEENINLEKYNSDICLVSEIYNSDHAKHDMIQSKISETINVEKGLVKNVKYTIKFCIKNNMRLIIAGKRDKKYNALPHQDEIKFYKNNLEKKEFDYFQRSYLERDADNFSSYKAVLNSKVAVGNCTTLLIEKLGTGGKILSCNLIKGDIYNFPINGICLLNNCSYEEFEKRLFEIYSMSKENFFLKIDKKPDYVMKFNKNNSTINIIREKLSYLGVNQN